MISFRYNNVLKDIIIFLIIFLSANSLTNYCFENIILDKFLENNEAAFVSDLKSTSIIALGDSHTAVSLNPRIIEGLYNYSNIAENYIHIYYRLKKHLGNKDLKIKVAILQMDPHCFTTEFLLQQNLYFMKHWIDPYELGLDLKKPFFTVVYYKVLANITYYVSGLKRCLGFLFRKKSNKSSYKGYIPLPINKIGTEALLKKKISQHFHYTEMFPEMKLYFEKILRLLESKNIKVILLTCPLSSAYFKEIPPSTLEIFFDYREMILKQYKNLHLVDYHDIFFTEDNSKGIFFSDFDHININGAQIVSRKLQEDILSKI